MKIFSFEYTKEWLNSGKAQYLDPDLQLYSGQQYSKEGKTNFGIYPRFIARPMGEAIAEKERSPVSQKWKERSKQSL